MISRLLTGGIMILLGIIGLVFSILITPIILIYSIPLIILGFFILSNRREDKIEQINRKVFI